MPTLKLTLREDLHVAMRARDEMRTATIRMVLSAITNEEVAGEVARELSQDELLVVLRREAKKRREAATAFADGGRPERAERDVAHEVPDVEGGLSVELGFRDQVHLEPSKLDGRSRLNNVKPNLKGRCSAR